MNFFREPTGETVRKLRMTGDHCIIRPEHLGVANGVLTLGTPHDHVLDVSGLFAPPYASTDFTFDVRLFGELVPTERWVWYPNMMFREGSVYGVHISSLLTLTKDTRSAVLSVALENTAGEAVTVPWMIHTDGSLDYVHDWAFAVPKTKHRGDTVVDGTTVLMKNSTKVYAVRTTMEGLQWFPAARLWESTLTLAAGETRQVTFTFYLGPREALDGAIKADPAACVESAYADLSEKTETVFSRLPQVHTSNGQMEAFYYRALMPLLLNVWNVEEFALHPYFSTGSVKGGCLASYLWDFSAGAKVLPMFDAAATKAQIMAYFKVNIFRSYAILPVSGNANGPWYPVNQEKIIDMVYQYVRTTGDIPFLFEQVGDKTVLQLVNENAFFGCEDAENGLIDYGVDGEDHLELKRRQPYHGILPDLNARRYDSFRKAAELNRLCGQEDSALLAAAETVKAAVREQLWSEEDGWFRVLSEGKQYLRYTVQMFKFCDSDVLDDAMREKLLAHLNEREFLSAYGLHSMSKQDPAYDQVDIDNGGGGICSIFPILIAEKLYRIGKYEVADDILRRILWWGTRMPYWGDSFVANYVEYRQNTPLQCTIGSITGAQYVLFGMAGVKAEADGTVTVCPHLPEYLDDLAVENIRLHGKCFSVRLTKAGYTVQTAAGEHTLSYGETFTL